jgi:hypothetical protein
LFPACLASLRSCSTHCVVDWALPEEVPAPELGHAHRVKPVTFVLTLAAANGGPGPRRATGTLAADSVTSPTGKAYGQLVMLVPAGLGDWGWRQLV